MGEVKGGTGVYTDETLVVDLPYMGRVREKVIAIGGGDGVIDQGEPSPALGLTRFRLPGLTVLGATLRAQVEDARRAPSRLLDHIHLPAEQASDLERLLFLVRLDFAGRNGGWVCEIGKDRDAETITGLPHLSGGLNGAGLSYPVVPQTVTYTQAADRQLGKGIRVGVLDTKLFRNAALAGQRLEIGDGDWLEPREVYPHWCGHGTFVLGLVAAQAPGATVVYRGVLDDDHARATSWDVAHRIVAMRDQGVKILNLSLGLVTEDGQEPLVLSRAIRQLGRDVVVVAAAGNHGHPEKCDRFPQLDNENAAYPAADSGVIAVGALDGAEVAGFTPKVSWLRFFSEGAEIQSTYVAGDVEIRVTDPDRPLVFDAGLEDDRPVRQRFDGFAAWAGTSMAAAVVTGRLAALTRLTGGDPRDALDLLRGGPSFTTPLTGPNPVVPAGDSRTAEESWRRPQE